MPMFLTTDEFTRWAALIDGKLDQHLEEVKSLREQTVENQIKIAVQEDRAGRAKTTNSAISACVAAITGALTSYLGGR